MKRGGVIAIGLLSVTAMLGAYLYVPSLLDGSFPGQTRAERFFRNNRDGLEALHRQLEADGLNQINCYPDLVRAGTDPKGPGEELSGESLTTYLPLCKDSRSGMSWRTESGYLFYFGGAANKTWEFQIALIRRDNGQSPVESCESIEPNGDFGKCQFQLSNQWALDYEWVAKSYLDSFSDDAT